MSVHASIDPLAWESDFFQRRLAQLVFSPKAPRLTLSAMQPYEVVQAKVLTIQVEMAAHLSELGFCLVEGEIDLSMELSAGHFSEQRSCPTLVLELHPAQHADLPWLTHQAATAFTLSRFRPPWYRVEDNARFYTTWVEKALNGTFDHQCLLAMSETGERQGFVTLRELPEGEARIGLLAVAPEAMGQGVGQRLMLQAQAWCRAHRLTRLRVATQAGNLSALRMYVRSGAQIDSIAYWLYR